MRGIYPTIDTAKNALKREDLFIYENEEKIIGASAIINKIQVDVYEKGNWKKDAKDDEIMVLHTLTVEPNKSHNGIGKKFVQYYENYAKENNCTELRLDTNEINSVERQFYKKLGYTEIGIVPTVFNGIPNVNLVLIEKIL